MGLIASQNSPGLWVNDQWPAGTPGLFAVVIGVSVYKHLEGGVAPAPETYGLGQLRVSALTAYRMFEWLRDGYRMNNCPVAHVWMLIAPTEKEKAFEPALTHHELAPSIGNCDDAIGQWQATMRGLPQAAAEESRALFFFSGHGLEVHPNRQILLPLDYLSPPARNVNNALSTENLINGLASEKVTRQFFFLDACRNDNQKLRDKRIEGRQVLNEDVTALINPDVIAPILYAAASGQQAFQQPEPQAGLSLFGTALIDGLAGKPDIELEPADKHWSVNVYPLQAYLKSRIVELLEEAQERVRQSVRLGGTPDNEIITLVPPPQRAVVTSPTAPPSPSALERAAQVEKALTAPFSVHNPIPKPAQDGSWSKDWSVAHYAFGAETATKLWWNLRLTALSSGRIKSSGDLALYQVSRAPDTRRFRVEFSPIDYDPLGHWLELDDSVGRFAAVLPSDRSEALRYVVEFDFDKDASDQVWRISHLEAMLSPSSSGLAGIAAKLWETYNASDAGTATQFMQDEKLAERLLSEKVESPLAAAIATLVLLRANRLDLLHDWVRNVADWFPQLPDGATLWAEQSLRQSKQANAIRETAVYTSYLTQRGLPMMAETVGYAARHLELLVKRADILNPDLLQRLAVLQERMARALVYFRADGLFPVFTGYEDGTQVLELMGLGVFAHKRIRRELTMASGVFTAKTKLAELQQSLEDKKRELEELKTGIAELDPMTKEIEQTVGGYEKSYASLKYDWENLDKYITGPGQEISEKTPEDKKEAVKNKTKESTDAAAKLKGALEVATKAHQDATEEKAQRKKAYDDLKNHQKTIEEKLKEGKNLREKAESAHSQHHPAKTYFLLSELGRVIKETETMLKTPDKLKEEISDASLAFTRAAVDLPKKKEGLETADKKWKEKPDLREEILKSIGDQ